MKKIYLSLFVLLLTACSKTQVNNSPDIIINKSFNIHYEVGSEEPNWLDAIKVIDKEDGEITLTLENVDTSNVNMDTLGDFDVVYEVIDSSGKSSTLKLSVRIVEEINESLVLSPGEFSNILISTTGRMYTWGSSYNYVNGDEQNILIPEELIIEFNLHTGETIKNILYGSNHYLAVTSKDRILAWGNNGVGQLGNGSCSNQYKETPIEVGNINSFRLEPNETIDKVAVGIMGRHNIVLSSHGRVFTWGFNHKGQLGHSDPTSNYPAPIEVTKNFSLHEGEKVIDVVTFQDHNLAITSYGRLFRWGAIGFDEDGNTTNYFSTVPMDITDKFNLLENEKIDKISVGLSHSVVASSNGRVFTWGNNDNGELGDGDKNKSYSVEPIEITQNILLQPGETIQVIKSGQGFNILLTSNGRIITWGYYFYGQLGNKTYEDSYVPVDVTQNFDLFSGESIVDINTGRYHSIAITSSGRVFIWGDNTYGQLGDGTRITQ